MTESAENVTTDDISKETERNNLYEYLDRDDFTSEKYKIEVRGLPKYYGIGEFKKFLGDKLELEFCKVKPPRKGSGWLYVSFRSAESRDKAISVLHGVMWKNSKLSAHAAAPAPDPFIKRKIEAREAASKRSKTEENDEPVTLVCSKVLVKKTTIPLWDMPYPEQLQLKQKEMKTVLIKMGQQILKENKNLKDWLSSQNEKYEGLPCELMPILSADLIEGYRNKCEFTIGRDTDGNKIIGFRLSSYAAGSTAVGPIDDLCHIPEIMKSAVKILEEFIHRSELDVYNPVNHTGSWRQVTARTTRLNHLMFIIGVHPQDLSPDDLTKLKTELRDFFENGKGAQAKVTSLFFQILDRQTGRSDESSKLEHLSGTEYIEENLLGMTFRISPQAFFQTNTLGAEVLYKAAIDLAKPTEETALIDVCCGTGTIGLAFSKHCGEVLGLEMVADAIKDAKVNTVQNGVTNCEFFVGKAEDVLSPVLHRTTKPTLVAIVDPPRAGLHHRALVALRKAKKLNRLVYISCDPKAAIKNLVDLARANSKHYSGEPLVPVKAVPVDMFPYTRHCELIIYLERLAKSE
ncbi:tRNA (uracil-5-)-methyltransferase homolog A [Belonocnema kinseyi]|uniref:tRNA (uracil-5-)-methyltransferase homolog A n=1 Tax=Belonocnema kinseyi TaxID=2817044 RepID=UPI00143D5584|nr:tRNA (uracil-5-)-methyltransferase homolog A [Belonocnema kinseyi]